jgi:hypothetical protein
VAVFFFQLERWLRDWNAESVSIAIFSTKTFRDPQAHGVLNESGSSLAPTAELKAGY